MKNNFYHLFLLLISMSSLFVGAFGANDKPSDALFVWKDELGSGRQEKVLFRRSFELREDHSCVNFHIFADSRYHLYVNGIHLAFGPSRFFLDQPQFDSYDLAPYLKSGENVIAVEVLANGTESFQLPTSMGGFVAWGVIQDGSVAHELSTPGDWRCLAPGSFDSEAVRFSFACAPMEIFDARKESVDWTSVEFDASSWKTPMVIQNQTHWGNMNEREIPFLTRDEYSVKELTGVFPLLKDEDLYYVSIKTPDETNSLYHSTTKHPFLAYSYIYSPIDQVVKMGGFWGRYFVNGEEAVRVEEDAHNPVRENRWFKLKQGWNELLIHGEGFWGSWENYFSFPKSAKLHLSPRKQLGDTEFLRVNPIVSADERDEVADALKRVQKLDDLPRSIAEMCQPVSLEAVGLNPARDLAWMRVDTSHNMKLNDFETGVNAITQPTVVTADLGRKSLGSVFLEIDAPEGAVIDVGWSEDLNPNNGIPFLYKRVMINSACRFITDGKRKRYETFKPYGVRHFVVLIRSPNGPVSLRKLGVVEQVYPFEKTGSFKCSNPVLNDIWELGWKTLGVCSEDSYTDTPFRERGLYAGDALPEYAITLATSGDSRLMKKSLQLFQSMYHDELWEGKKNRHDDFVLKTLIELYWYHKVTDDTDFVRQVYLSYKSHLDHLEATKDPLGYYVSGKVFLEWTKLNKTAQLTAFQSLSYACLRMMSDLAKQLNYDEDAITFDARAEALKKVVNQNFWDDSRGLFFDGYHNGEKLDSSFLISNVMPLLFGLVPDERVLPILSFIADEIEDIGEISRNRKTTPYSSFYLISALYQYQRADLAEKFILKYWSRMIHKGNDTTWENFDIDFGGQGTASHAWSGHPTYFLSTEVLGVKLGFQDQLDTNTIYIQPQSETLDWARGTVPHPLGDVHVNWKVKGEHLFMEVSGPESVEIVVEPRGRLGELKLHLQVNKS